MLESDAPDGSDVAFVVAAGVDDLAWGEEPERLRAFRTPQPDRSPPDPVVRAARRRPVANHLIERPVALWTRDRGVLDDHLAAIAAGEASAYREAAPSADVEREAVRRQLATTEHELDEALERYWDGDWRREHHGGGRYPEHTLWDLAWGARDLRRLLER